MSKIIKEPFAPRMIHDRRITFFFNHLQRSAIAFPKLANASSEDICMIVLLVSLLLTTLLLPWIVL